MMMMTTTMTSAAPPRLVSRAAALRRGRGRGRPSLPSGAAGRPGDVGARCLRRRLASAADSGTVDGGGGNGRSRRGGGGRPPLPLRYLDASDPRRYDPSTRQRVDVSFDPVDGRPPTPARDDGDGGPRLGSWEHVSGSDGNDEDGGERNEAGGGGWELTTTTTTAAATSSGEGEGGDASRSCRFSDEWIASHSRRWRSDPDDYDVPWDAPSGKDAAKEGDGRRVLWSHWTEDLVRDPDSSPILFDYDRVFAAKEEERRMMEALHQYGLVLITDTPIRTDSIAPEAMSEATRRAMGDDGRDESAEAAISRLASTLGYHPMRTLYGGGVWSTSSRSSFYDGAESGNDSDGDDIGSCDGSMSTADSAYGVTSLPLHTDMTYLSSPPGVQVFLMVQPADKGENEGEDADATDVVPTGQSTYLDGFAAARKLREEHPDAYRTLATTPRRYRSVDDQTGWHLEAVGPVIETAPGGRGEFGPVRAVRHNDLDRLPDLPPYRSDVAGHNYRQGEGFYRALREAHEAWDNVLRRDEMRLALNLRPGDCTLVANRRVMHGRYAFETSEFPRVVMGCYVGQDELDSKWRRIGIGRAM
ncbi:hypothetical protein ACHAWF_005846 [Thalassiosira exigua]